MNFKIEKNAEEYKKIPICREIYADMITPISIAQKLSAKNEPFFLLESVEGGEKWARYSFLGFENSLRIACKEGMVEITGEYEKQIKTQKPFDVLREVLSENKAPRIEGMPPFAGGLVGYFAYAMMEYAEPTLSIKRDKWNDFDVMLFDKVIAYDHLKQKILLIINIKTDRLEENQKKAERALDEMEQFVAENIAVKQAKIKSNPQFVCNVSEKEYAEIVQKTKDYIVKGDIFQAVQSRKFQSEYKESLLAAYRVLRTTNPSPYMVFLSMGEEEIMCSSPETLVRVQNGRVTTFPVAGSRPRGKTEAEDSQLEQELLQDEKELSEHNMLVDLGRNDLGRICKIGTVEVTHYMDIHKYSKIMHICSQVEGNIKKENDALSALESVLPAGTLSGAPKIRACEIIEELEPEARGVYGGAIGYLDFTGNMDTCIAIRMAAKKDGVVTVQAGGGIVADSLAKNEYLESENKAKAVIDALIRAKEV